MVLIDIFKNFQQNGNNLVNRNFANQNKKNVDDDEINLKNCKKKHDDSLTECLFLGGFRLKTQTKTKTSK